MKRRILPILCILLLFAASALAQEPFAIDEHRKYTGMPFAYAQGYEPGPGKDGYVLMLPIVSEVARGTLTATLTIGNPEVSPFVDKEVTKSIQPDKNGRSWNVSFTLAMRREAYNGMYAAALRLQSKDADGNDLTQDISLVLPLRGATEEPIAQALDVVSVVPGVQGLAPGGRGELICTLSNKSPRNALTNVQVTLNEPSGAILPQGTHTLSLESIAPGQQVQVTCPVLLQPDSRPRLHVVSASAQATRFSGAVDTLTRAFTVSVTQDMRLKLGQVQFPPQAAQGDLLSFELPLMNMGKGTIHNTLLSFSLPGLSQGESVLAGNIEPGGTVQARATLRVGAAPVGEVSGTVDISFEDAEGTASHLSLPLDVNIIARPAPLESKATPDKSATQSEGEPSLMTVIRQWAPVGTAGLLLILLAWQGLYYRGKMRRMEEQRL